MKTLGYDGLLSNIVAGPKYIQDTVSTDEAFWENLEMNQLSGIEKTFLFHTKWNWKSGKKSW